MLTTKMLGGPELLLLLLLLGKEHSLASRLLCALLALGYPISVGTQKVRKPLPLTLEVGEDFVLHLGVGSGTRIAVTAHGLIDADVTERCERV